MSLLASHWALTRWLATLFQNASVSVLSVIYALIVPIQMYCILIPALKMAPHQNCHFSGQLLLMRSETFKTLNIAINTAQSIKHSISIDWNIQISFTFLRGQEETPTGAGGKPSTWFSPEGLLEPPARIWRD